MDKRVRIEKGFILHRIFSCLLDILLTSLFTISLYFIVLFGVFGTCFNYVGNEFYINETLKENDLTLSDNLSYEKYEEVIQHFYFDKYSNEIIKDYEDLYKEKYTIYHIYNVVVLGLPSKVTDVTKSDYFEYVLNNDSTVNYDVVAKTIPGSGKNYEKNMHDIFYNQYKKLNNLLERYDYDYFNILSKNNLYKFISRTVAIYTSFIILFVIIPLQNKNSSTFGEKKFKLGYVDGKNGYVLKKYKVILKNLITYFIPSLGVVFFSLYSFIILTIGWLFLNFIIMVFSSDNKDISEKILNIESIDVEQSLVFKNKKEEEEFEKNL